ncbi:MAG: AmmeMemoRadiSam system protein B [Deltaproteobacteria bacterium]|nr:AmmeMemoRadiSam system protein B [Deltaproteobacteria bacterium]
MVRRPPCVAGRFYPGEPEILERTVDTLLFETTREDAISIVSPHAGYIYSGAVAGAVFSSVNLPDNIILIGPNHTGLGQTASLMARGYWDIPTGRVEINSELAGLLLDSGAFSDDKAAHLMEHSLEVQLPFIRSLNKKASIVPITVMRGNADECAGMGEALAGAVLAYKKPVLIVVSSDMNHYETDIKTREKDKLAIDRVLKLDAAGLLNITSSRNISMCGVIPAAIAITASRLLGAREARLVKYSTSGETSGDMKQVVGYAGILIK